MKYHLSDCIFNFSWDQVARAFWNRYPNPHSNHVLTEDVVSREIVDGKLITKKIITKTNKIPKWCEKFIRGHQNNRVHMVEESIVDPQKKVLTTYIRNIGMTSILVVGEKAVFKAEPGFLTLCQRTGWAESKLRIYGVARPIESLVMERFKKNIKSTARGFEFVLEKMYPMEHITPTISQKIFLKDKAKKAKEIATRAGQNVVTTYTGQTAA